MYMNGSRGVLATHVRTMAHLCYHATLVSTSSSCRDHAATTHPIRPPPRSAGQLLPPLPLLDHYPRPSPPVSTSTRPGKRLAPGLLARLQRLVEQKRRLAVERQRQDIGRIPEQQLAHLERLQPRCGVEVRAHSRQWKGQIMPAGGVRLDGGPVLSDAEASMLESDTSSIVDVSDHMVVDSEDESGLDDHQKYRMPDGGKTRLHLHTKEPLSPTPRQIPPSSTLPRRNTTPTPTAQYLLGGANSASLSRRQSRHPDTENFSDSDAVRSGLSRAGSIYTLSRVSFTGQLAQLTSMHLPDANSLAKRISDIPTSKDAASALSDAGEQIRMWIKKASEVLSGLDAEDDAEWAAAGGRDGIEDVDMAINRFERLVQVYILSIERLQARTDVAALSAQELTASVRQMEGIMISWQKIKDTLSGVKAQVEIAMEWEVLWNTVLGEIGQEMGGLNRLVFEMEEQRHQGAESLLTSKDSIDLTELETIVDDKSIGNVKRHDRFTLPTLTRPSPAHLEHKDDATLLALFARMQPMRASLDFLPMRLAVFQATGRPIFPTACDDLVHRQEQLETQWRKLELDAESLRRELGEDRWILVFRNAGKQAWKMCESIGRSFDKLKAGIDAGEQQTNPDILQKRMENYEAKQMHYGPAIGRVLAIIDKGVADRLTVNGEILRLQSDIKTRWTTLQSEMRDMDLVIEEINNDPADKPLRDSVSTVVSSERSVASSLVDTPASSPASSVTGDSRKNSVVLTTPTPLANVKIRHDVHGNGNSRYVSESFIPVPGNLHHRPGSPRHGNKTALHHKTSITFSIPSGSMPGSRTSSMSTTRPSRPDHSPDFRPRWITVAKSDDKGFLPFSALEPSPYAKVPITPRTNFLRASRLAGAPTSPVSAPAARPSRNFSSPLPPSSLPRLSTPRSDRKSSLPVLKMAHATPPRSSPLSPSTSKATLRPASRLESRNERRSSLLAPISAPADGNEADNESPSHHHRRPVSRPQSAMNGRRSAMMPSRNRMRMDEGAVGVEGDRPKWRP